LDKTKQVESPGATIHQIGSRVAFLFQGSYNMYPYSFIIQQYIPDPQNQDIVLFSGQNFRIVG
jgi:glutathione synthase/RimK-type ligase-like ATP-grasp enzyme